MNLPNADQAQVDRKKITEYLLYTSHPGGSNKAIFFSQFGFTLENWKILAESLRKVVIRVAPSFINYQIYLSCIHLVLSIYFLGILIRLPDKARNCWKSH